MLAQLLGGEIRTVHAIAPWASDLLPFVYRLETGLREQGRGHQRYDAVLLRRSVAEARLSLWASRLSPGPATLDLTGVERTRFAGVLFQLLWAISERHGEPLLVATDASYDQESAEYDGLLEPMRGRFDVLDLTLRI